jgi:hypothetical protein
MIVVAATLVGLLSVKLFGGRLRSLALLDLRHLWIVWAAIVIQTVIFEVVGSALPEVASQAIHIGTYVMAFAFLWFNRHIPGVLVVATGAACNAIVITANGGVMPASAAAWRRAGHATVDPATFENSNVVADARLSFLGDVFAVPAGWPLANVFSIGDVIVVVGATYLAHRCCRRPEAAAIGGSAIPNDSGQSVDETGCHLDGRLAQVDDHQLAIGHDQRELSLVAVAGETPGELWPAPPVAAIAEAGLRVGRDVPARVIGPANWKAPNPALRRPIVAVELSEASEVERRREHV